eukprot:scaffold123288_cov50-Attheya_sp.AAC.3
MVIKQRPTSSAAFFDTYGLVDEYSVKDEKSTLPVYSSKKMVEETSSCSDDSTISGNIHGPLHEDCDKDLLPMWETRPTKTTLLSKGDVLPIFTTSHVAESSALSPFRSIVVTIKRKKDAPLRLLLLVCLAVAAYSYMGARSELSVLQSRLSSLNQGLRTHEEALTNNEELTQSYEEAIAELQETHGHLEAKLSSPVRALLDALPEEMIRQLKGLSDISPNDSNRIAKIRRQIQAKNKQDVLEKYGPGPYQVEFELDFSPDENEEPTKFVVEMAPLDLMPHSVHHFLEMISHGLLNGFAFNVGEYHIVMAGVKSGEMEQVFKKARLTTLTFPEYSHEFPHDPYTLGFSGAPPGPSWYINTVDNVEHHGPGGQEHHRGLDGDPCFAKVVSGFDVVDRIQMNLLDLEHNVEIQRARILPKEQHQMRR